MTLFNIQNSFTCKLSLFLSFFWFPWVSPLLRAYVLEFYYGIRAELVESFIWYSLKLSEFTSSIFYLFPYFQCLVLPDQVEKFFFVFFFWFLILALFFCLFPISFLNFICNFWQLNSKPRDCEIGFGIFFESYSVVKS